jgi:hypothetical protein
MTIKQGVLILGTYRSGTSAIAGVLHHLGFDSNARPLADDNLAMNPLGSYLDKYFTTPDRVDFNEYFEIKNSHDLWVCKNHIFFQNNLISKYKEHFPVDRESWLLITEREPQTSIDSFRALSAYDFTDTILRQKQIIQDTYAAWDSKKIVVNFNELKANPYLTVKKICDRLGATFVEAAAQHIQADLSKFGA